MSVGASTAALRSRGHQPRAGLRDRAEQIACEVLRMETARDVNNYLREQTQRLIPRYDEVRA